ncbi:probable cyclic nucleotide-gated ion channel 20, chloroplastic [Papaver somniferum]|uniref:probable cyclic nucleotide-gated ion channel 20, chloroplastic n=1 Tax=Papaver somniferum TaxID=3469 RepID=UPI000E700B4B|nr:probable cyclic nucleotide-gated ion channel 20, chloroplastic [Papaver somniferum]
MGNYLSHSILYTCSCSNFVFSGFSSVSGQHNAERDDKPMLWDNQSTSYTSRDVELPEFTVRTRSASMSKTPYSVDSFVNENQPVFHTGPLGSGRRAPPIVHMSGPLNPYQKPDSVFLPMKNLTVPTTPNILALDYSSFKYTDEKGSPVHSHSTTNEHLMKSGQLGMCNDPYCTTCPTYKKAAQWGNSKPHSDLRFQRFAQREDIKGWARRSYNFLYSHIPGIMNPHAKVVQQWNKFFVISCLVAIFVDPLFFLLLSVREELKCIVLDWRMAITIAVVRSVTDLIYAMHMILQFRLAYVAPESRVVGAGDLVDQPKKIALNYVYGYFFIDLFVVLPLPQIMILVVLPRYVGSSAANYAKNLLRATVLLQYIPRIFRCLPLLAGRSPSGFIFETAWANFVINLLMFVLAGHVVGSCWYLFGLQRVNQCLRDACDDFKNDDCKKFMDCGNGDNISSFQTYPSWVSWQKDKNATDCLDKDSKRFNYGIYGQAVKITTGRNNIVRYVYSLFWGFQQISTLAGNLVPSDFVWEVLFTMAIIALGLFLFALLIGNMQNFLIALGRRRLDMQLRRRDVEQWMDHRRLPEGVKRRVRQSERFSWAATQGINEEVLLGNLSEDLQIDVRRHLFKFVKKVRIFALMDDPIFDAICKKLKQKIYIPESRILYYGGPVDKLVFIVRGKLESVGADGNIAELSEGNVFGEELLALCLEQASVNRDGKKIKTPGHRVISNRTVTCLTNVESFSLKVDDLEEVTAFYAAFLRKPIVQAAIRYKSPFWRGLAATRIQVAWRYRKKRLSRANKSISQ